MTNERGALLDLMTNAGIRAVLLKGQALIERIRGDAKLGVYGDLDILVEPESARSDDVVLLRRGYHLHDPPNARLAQWDPRETPHVFLKHQDLGFRLPVDLRSQNLPNWAGQPIHAERLRKQTVVEDFRGSQMLRLFAFRYVCR